MPPPEFDLIVRAGRVVCPATGQDGPGAVAVRDGRIAAVFSEPEDIAALGRPSFDFPGGVLLPGLIDLHGHPAGSLSKYGVDADACFLACGTTTVLSQGDAGAANWPAFRDEVVGRAQTRVRLAINLAAHGEAGPVGCFHDPAEIDVEACVRCVQDAGPAVWGIAVNLSLASCGPTDPRFVLRSALAAAERTGKPLLVGPRRGADDLPWEELLDLLRPGDVVTYCLDGGPQGILSEGHVRPSVRCAQERGVLFDVGHGRASFDLATAEAAIGEGFLPDTISTDLHRGHRDDVPRHDLPRTISKLIAAGMTERDAFLRVTSRPAQVLGLADEIGSLRPGACADLTVLRVNPTAAPLADTRGMVRAGPVWEPVLIVRSGAV